MKNYSYNEAVTLAEQLIQQFKMPTEQLKKLIKERTVGITNTVPIVRWPELVIGGGYACLAYMTPFKYGPLSFIEELIVVDDNFLELPDVQKTFLIYHELGHREYGHTNKMKTPWATRRALKKRIKCIKKGRVIQDELDADAYAVKNIGKEAGIAALTSLLDVINESELSNKELLLRIQQIEKMEDTIAC